MTQLNKASEIRSNRAKAIIAPYPRTTEVKPKRSVWKARLGLIGFLGLVGLGIYGYFNYTYGEGGYSGYVRMIHRVGGIKTWEGELDKRKMGGSYHSEDIFEFSVQDAIVAKKIQEAEQTGEWVTVHYKQYLSTLPWRGKTVFIVYDVTATGKKE